MPLMPFSRGILLSPVPHSKSCRLKFLKDNSAYSQIWSATLQISSFLDFNGRQGLFFSSVTVNSPVRLKIISFSLHLITKKRHRENPGTSHRIPYKTFARNSFRRSCFGWSKISSGVPSSSSFPSAMKSTRFPTSFANPISWVTTTMVMPS